MQTVLYLARQSVDADGTLPGLAVCGCRWCCTWPGSLWIRAILYLAGQSVDADGTVPDRAVCGCRWYCSWPGSLWMQTILYLAGQSVVADGTVPGWSVWIRAGHVPTFLKSFRSRTRGFSLIVPFSFLFFYRSVLVPFRPVPFRSE